MARQRRHFESRPAAIDLEDDSVCRFRPDVRLRIGVVVFDIIVDGAFELRHACENASANALFGDFAEPALHQVQPR